MSDIWAPTLELKWQEVNPTPENDPPALVTVYGGSVYVLQQKWVNLDKVFEWRDIPLERSSI